MNMVHLDKMKWRYSGVRGDEVMQFEAFIGYSLPSDYRDFIVECNGGIPACQFFPDAENPIAVVDLLFPINTDLILEEIEAFPFCLEKNLLPIGSGGGDYLFLGLLDGCVYHWDHEECLTVDVSREELTFLSASFREFFSGLNCDTDDGRSEIGEIEMIAKSGDLRRLEEFLDRNHIDSRNRAGRTVAAEAARYGNLDVLKKCIELGADRRGLLHRAVIGSGREDVVEYLLNLGLGINDLNEKGKRPLFYCHPELRDYLIYRGATE